jgi:hypothetical protein
MPAAILVNLTEFAALEDSLKLTVMQHEVAHYLIGNTR